MSRKNRKTSKTKGKKSSKPGTKGSKEPNFPDIDYDQGIPVYDFFEYYDINSDLDLPELLDDLVFSIKEGYFLRWEAVLNNEQGLPLTRKQQETLDELINFSDDDNDEPVFYINEIPRPSEPWYETVRKVAPKLILHPFKTYGLHDGIYYEGWPMLVECLEYYGKDLSFPEGISSPMDIIPPKISHRLWLQFCFDELSGLGQEEELTLENEDQKPWRIKNFIDDLKEHKASVKYYDLSLKNLFEFVELPPRDEKILVESMKEKLGIKSISDKLFDVL